ncbi:MAG: chitobiase/beta-hexosaminidase C-terminal domain-containing protein, partial [Bacteroidales bacterium]|nr:chitobiase/beta-hexosaminidase C-terminal domain-containing protein [Bacteroidales bacterium]
LTTEEDLEEAIGVFMPYDDDDKITLEAFGITEEDLEEGDVVMTLKAAAAVIDGEGNITWSTTTNATFTVKGNVPAGAVAQPVITPDMKDGVIKLNQKVTIECATEGASIYYTLDGSDPDATKTLYEAPFLLPENTPVDEEITIKAIAIKDGVSSLVRISVLMVEEAGEGPDDPVTPPAPAEKPEAPKFEVDGKAVTVPALAVEAEKVEVKWIGEASEDYVVVYTLDGSEAVFDATSMEDEVLEDALYWSFGDEAIDVTVPATIKARVAAATNAGDITWSDMTTLDLMAPVPAPTFEPASGTKVDFGAELTLSCATEDAWILYTLDGSEPSADNDNAHYYSEFRKPGITAQTIKAVAMVKGVYSEVVTATYEFNPITATLSLVPMKDDTVGMNVGTGIEFSIDGWEEYAGVAVYYTVDGTTEPTEAAYEAQSDKANGAIKKLTVETKEYESWGETYTEIVRTDGHALAITFKEATHLKAIGTITVLGEKVTTTPLDAELKIKSAVKPTFSLADGTEVAEGDELVIENPNPYPEMPAMPEWPEDYFTNEESAAAYDKAMDAYRDAMDEYDAAVAAIPATIMYFSFDGTEPTSVAYDGQPAYEYDKWNVFKTGEGQNVTVFFQKDEEGYYLYVPEVIGYNSPADTIRLSGESLTLKAMSVTTEQGENGGGVSPYANRAAGGDFAFMYGSDFATAEFTVAEPDVEKELPETVEAPVFVPAAGAVKRGTEVTWTWNEEYDYDVMGVVYVANGKDEDLNIDAAKFEELVAAWGEEEENLVREDGKVYLYYEGEGAYKVEKAATLKARLVLGIMKDVEEGEEGENPGMEIALSPVVTAAYTIDSLANEDLELAGV